MKFKVGQNYLFMSDSDDTYYLQTFIEEVDALGYSLRFSVIDTNHPSFKYQQKMMWEYYEIDDFTIKKLNKTQTLVWLL